MDLRPWEFWIDVGGTFTDCVARRPDGTLARHKLLSSGVTKGIAGQGSNIAEIVDPARADAPAGYWNGAKLRLLDVSGHSVVEAAVIEFDTRRNALRLDRALDRQPTAGQPYELIFAQSSPVLAIRFLLGLSADQTIPPVLVRLGTTRGTNALITRSGAKAAFVTTRGFGDVLRIGYQNRPRLFDLNIRKPPPLFETVVEIDERVAADGVVLKGLDPAAVRGEFAALAASDIESLAICLLHGSQFPAHERQIAAIAREVGFTEISVSSEVAPLVKIVPRGDTTMIDAYLNPILRGYVGSLEQALAGCDLRFVTSAGGLARAEQFTGKDSILSGPAGGVVGFSRIAQAAGFDRAIGFDMGGTSTDVSRFEGRFELEYETEKAGVRVVAPMMAIETVAAGGGSICQFDGVKLTVGPASAGAEPGPACYGRGGPLAVTDVNFFLGKILPEHFPFPLDRAAVQSRLQAIAETIAAETDRRMSLVELADGFVQIANSNMARALRSISIAKGCDPRDYVLVPFGGAAGQHACALARELGIRQLLCHPDAGLLSARGIGLAEHTRHQSTGVYRPYSPAAVAALEPIFAQLIAEATADLASGGRKPSVPDAADPSPSAPQQSPISSPAGGRGEEIDLNEEEEAALERAWARLTFLKTHRHLDLRYAGIESTLTITEPADQDYAAAFHAAHEKLYGYCHANRPLEIVAARVDVISPGSTTLAPSHVLPPMPFQSQPRTTIYFDAKPHAAQVITRGDLEPGHEIRGPAIIHEFASTTIIDPGWRANILSQGEMLITDTQSTNSALSAQQVAPQSDLVQPDPVQLEIFNHHFAGIAEQMGITLRNTAGSVNVKERLDFSCAIFTPQGELVVNAPHIPVHLGAMGETVRRILADEPSIRPGDVFVTNDPYRGGSHLPDVTVVTPVFESAASGQNFNANDSEPELLFFTASRAHHAEIGGIVPGSMPPNSRNLAEEGVLIRCFKLIDASQSRFDQLRAILSSGDYPSRNVEDNLTDIAAQVAANRQGATRLLELIASRTLPVVRAYMSHIQTAAEVKLRRALENLPAGKRTFTDHLDDGSPIRVEIDIAKDRNAPIALTIDFTGTGPVLPGNLNANRAIVMAAVMYVLRLLIDEDIPLNEGVLKPVRLVLPECLLNPPERATPRECAAMAAGNVETSQRVVDALLGAFGLAAASQGTMNNLLFGDATFGYYETICGGSGATATADGADAVQTHMTNTRLTDPELIERRYPVRLLEFSIRAGSGGAGQHRGGAGVTRRLEFLRPLEVSLITERRGPYASYGMSGGQSGSFGQNKLIRADGQQITLSAKAQLSFQPGDVLVIETPGGGGWGELEK